jgi:hypothetical protein
MLRLNRQHIFLLVALAAAAIILLASPEVSAQGCSMCKAVLTSSTNGRFIRNYNIGVLVLLIPPVSIFCSIFIVLKRHRGENLESEEPNREPRAVATGCDDPTERQRG